MSSYTITITPDDSTNASATLRVSLGVNGARIKELTVRAGDGEGFALEALPAFELSRLIGAIAPGPGTPVIDAPATEGSRAADGAGAGVEAAAPARGRRSRPGAKAAKKAAGRGGAAPAAAKKAATKATAKKAGRAAKATTGGDGRESRAYRRMPDDVVEVFRQAGGATALANHYGVPRHTAQGWLRRLRQQGEL